MARGQCAIRAAARGWSRLARVRARLAENAGARRLGGNRVAKGIRRPRSFGPRADRVVRGICARRRTLPSQRVLCRTQPCRTHADRLRHTRAEGISSLQDPRRRCHLVPGLFRARRRVRSCEPQNTRPRRGRRARHRWPEDLVELCRYRRLAGAVDPHRSQSQDLRRALLGHLPDELAGDYRAADPHHGRATQILRSVL